jgi:hypothetical protein
MGKKNVIKATNQIFNAKIIAKNKHSQIIEVMYDEFLKKYG